MYVCMYSRRGIREKCTTSTLVKGVLWTKGVYEYTELIFWLGALGRLLSKKSTVNTYTPCLYDQQNFLKL